MAFSKKKAGVIALVVLLTASPQLAAALDPVVCIPETDFEAPSVAPAVTIHDTVETGLGRAVYEGLSYSFTPHHAQSAFPPLPF